MAKIDDKKIWQTDAFKLWWQEDFSYSQKQEEWWNAHWKKIDPVEFSFGKSGRKWSRFHLPPFDIYGEPCPPDKWSEAKGTIFCEKVSQILKSHAAPTAAVQNDSKTDWSTRQADLRGVVFASAEQGILFFPEDGKTLCADFSSAMFLEKLNCSYVELLCNFDSCTFFSYADFEGAQFPKGANFSGATFLNTADFDSAETAECNFQFSEFFERALFQGAKFAGNANFIGCTFKDVANFHSRHFAGSANFAYAHFLGNDQDSADAGEDPWSAMFSNAIFDKNIQFSNSLFNSRASFRGDTNSVIGGRAYFDEAIFRSSVNFSGRRFIDALYLKDTTFHDLALFHGAQIHPEAYFSEDAFRKIPQTSKVLDRTVAAKQSAKAQSDFNRQQASRQRSRSPKMLQRWQNSFQKAADDVSYGYKSLMLKFAPFPLRWPGMKDVRDAYDKEAMTYEYAFRTLRLASAANKNIEQESMFYKLELDARNARPNLPMFERALTSAYRAISLYGQSTTRPILVFLLVFAASMWAHIIAAQSFSTSSSHPDFSSLLYWTFRQFIPPPLVWSEQEMANAPAWISAIWKTNPDLLFAIGTFQVLAFVTLLAVFLIAIRRRFQLN